MTETPKPQPTVTRGTFITGMAGAGYTVAVSAESVNVLYTRLLTGQWPEALPVSTSALLGGIIGALIGIAGALLYWGLSLIPGAGNPFKSRPMFQPKDDAK